MQNGGQQRWVVTGSPVDPNERIGFRMRSWVDLRGDELSGPVVDRIVELEAEADLHQGLKPAEYLELHECYDRLDNMNAVLRGWR